MHQLTQASYFSKLAQSLLDPNPLNSTMSGGLPPLTHEVDALKNTLCEHRIHKNLVWELTKETVTLLVGDCHSIGCPCQPYITVFAACERCTPNVVKEHLKLEMARDDEWGEAYNKHIEKKRKLEEGGPEKDEKVSRSVLSACFN